MPLVTNTTEVVAKQKQTDYIVDVKPKVASEEDFSPSFQDNVVNTQEIHVSNLLVHAIGYSWTLHAYYNQVLGPDQRPSHQDVGGALLTQQYTLISNLELKVEQPLQTNTGQNVDSKSWNINGSGTIYAGLVPQTGDVFIADIGDGRKAVLQVTATHRKSIMKATCYTIEYKAVDYLDDARQTDLDTKTIRRLSYHRERLSKSTRGLLTEEQDNWAKEVKVAIETIKEAYSTMFLWADENTFKVPSPGNVYSRPITEFINAVGMVPDNSIQMTIEDTDPPLSVLDLLLGKKTMMRLVGTESNPVSVTDLTTRPVYGGIRYSTFDFYEDVIVSDVIYDEVPVTEIPSFRHNSVDEDNFIFSTNFYSNLIYSKEYSLASTLEQQAFALLKNQAIDTAKVLELVNDMYELDELTAFYQLPILFVLLQTIDQEL